MIQSIATFANIRDVNQLNIFVSGKIVFTRQNALTIQSMCQSLCTKLKVFYCHNVQTNSVGNFSYLLIRIDIKQLWLWTFSVSNGGEN